MKTTDTKTLLDIIDTQKPTPTQVTRYLESKKWAKFDGFLNDDNEVCYRTGKYNVIYNPNLTDDDWVNDVAHVLVTLELSEERRAATIVKEMVRK
jgi:NCAIR mutase (PurE)-related protein